MSEEQPEGGGGGGRGRRTHARTWPCMTREASFWLFFSFRFFFSLYSDPITSAAAFRVLQDAQRGTEEMMVTPPV